MERSSLLSLDKLRIEHGNSVKELFDKFRFVRFCNENIEGGIDVIPLDERSNDDQLFVFVIDIVLNEEVSESSGC